MQKTSKDGLRTHVIELMKLRGAHADFDSAIAGFDPGLRGAKPPGAPHTAWQLLEHMRIAQHDILDFSRNPDYKEPHWPDDYWPPSELPPDPEAWDRSCEQFRKDAADMEALVDDPSSDLFAQIPHGSGQTLLREALLVADHNAYHLGQLVLLRKLLGDWK
ncbi:MAG: DinB family protein [Paludibaculum sp.]